MPPVTPSSDNDNSYNNKRQSDNDNSYNNKRQSLLSFACNYIIIAHISTASNSWLISEKKLINSR